MIKLNIQLFGGDNDKNPGVTTNRPDDIIGRPQNSMFIGKFKHTSTAGHYSSREHWDEIGGKANTYVAEDTRKYFREQGVSISGNSIQGNNKKELYNTLHFIKSKNDNGDEMFYIAHIGYDGKLRISEPGHSAKILDTILHDYTRGVLIETDKGYFEKAAIIKGKIDFKGKDKYLGKTEDGVSVYQDENGQAIDKDGNAISKYINSEGKTITKDEDGIYVDEQGNEQEPLDIPDDFSYDGLSPMERMNNEYYRDLYSREEGTLGRDILDNQTSLYEKEAANAGILADASLQSQAMAQAQGIKQVTDALRNERMAQLRAGMSEAQLADRELSMLMGTVNQFSQQAQQASADALTARLGTDTAREEAFNKYIETTTPLGQNASANYASQVGDLITQALNYQQTLKQQTGQEISIGKAIDKVMGLEAQKQ